MEVGSPLKKLKIVFCGHVICDLSDLSVGTFYEDKCKKQIKKSSELKK